MTRKAGRSPRTALDEEDFGMQAVLGYLLVCALAGYEPSSIAQSGYAKIRAWAKAHPKESKEIFWHAVEDWEGLVKTLGAEVPQ